MPCLSLQDVEHLKNPAQLLGRGPASTRRRLQDAPAATTPAGLVTVILPFRGANLNLLPSLLKNFGRVKMYTSEAFRVIISPVSWAHPTLSEAVVRDRVNAAVQSASATLLFDVSVATPLTAEEQTRQGLQTLLRPFLDATGVPDMVNITAAAEAGVLPNPFIAAVVGALKLVPRNRAPVVVLDSATFAVPDDLVKKTLWRIVNGRVIYSPVSSFEDDVEENGGVLSDGGLASTGNVTAAPFTSASFWDDVEGLHDPTRRALRVGGRSLSQVNTPGGDVVLEDNRAEDTDDDDFTGPNQYGDTYADILDGSFDDVREWERRDPSVENREEDGYGGVGSGYGEDEDAFHSYFNLDTDDDDVDEDVEGSGDVGDTDDDYSK